jgi:hypothetical protein
MHVSPQMPHSSLLKQLAPTTQSTHVFCTLLQNAPAGQAPPQGIAVSSFLVPRREALRGGASWRPPPATW